MPWSYLRGCRQESRSIAASIIFEIAAGRAPIIQVLRGRERNPVMRAADAIRAMQAHYWSTGKLLIDCGLIRIA
jgi:hypothetical protein